MKTLSLALLVSIAAVQVSAQDLTPERKPVPSDSLQSSSFIDALFKVASQFELPLAVEWMKSPDTLKPIRLSRNYTNAGEALDAVVSAQSDYDWRLESGIVHVFQKTIVNDPRNPLNARTTLPDGNWTVIDANNFLLQSIGPLVDSIGPKVVPVPAPFEEEPQFPLGAHDALVREVLNKVITASKKKIWVAIFPSDLPLTTKGFWDTTAMYDPRYIKPEDQPFWIFLRWGDASWKRLESPEP